MELTACEFMAAFQAWQMALTAKCDPKVEEDVNDLALHYGKHISTPENIEAVSHCFDWDKILPIIGLS